MWVCMKQPVMTFEKIKGSSFVDLEAERSLMVDVSHHRPSETLAAAFPTGVTKDR